MNGDYLKKLILIFILAFAMNWIWENLHAVLYYLPDGGEITQKLLLRSTFYDAVFITILGFIFIKFRYFRQNLWQVLVFGFFLAIIIEWRALAEGRWAYNELMPIVPFLNTGLTPTIQLGLLGYFTVWLIDAKQFFIYRGCRQTRFLE